MLIISRHNWQKLFSSTKERNKLPPANLLASQTQQQFIECENLKLFIWETICEHKVKVKSKCFRFVIPAHSTGSHKLEYMAIKIEDVRGAATTSAQRVCASVWLYFYVISEAIFHLHLPSGRRSPGESALMRDRTPRSMGKMLCHLFRVFKSFELPFPFPYPFPPHAVPFAIVQFTQWNVNANQL